MGSAAGVGVGGGTTVAPELDVVADDEDAGGEQDVGGGAALLGLIGEVRVGERKVVRMTERNWCCDAMSPAGSSIIQVSYTYGIEIKARLAWHRKVEEAKSKARAGRIHLRTSSWKLGRAADTPIWPGLLVVLVCSLWLVSRLCVRR